MDRTHIGECVEYQSCNTATKQSKHQSAALRISPATTTEASTTTATATITEAHVDYSMSLETR